MMKRIAIKMSVAMAACFGFLFTGTADGQLQTAHYFPALAEGNTWNYAVDVDVEALGQFLNQTATVTAAPPIGIHGVLATPLQRTSSIAIDQGDAQTFSLGSTGLYLHREDFSLTTTSFDLPPAAVQLLPAAINIGQTYNFNYTYNGQQPSNGGTWSGSLTGSIQVIGMEAVVVPAGSFASALKITYNTSWSESGSNSGGAFAGSGTTQETWWLDPGFGIIKRDSTRSSTYADEPTVQYSAELTSATLFSRSDLDGDGDVDGVDIGVMVSNFTGPGGGPATNPLADHDGDGDVDGVDIASTFGDFTGPLSPATVPEPAGIMLLAVGGLLVNRRRRVQ